MQRFKNILLLHEPGARGRKARNRAMDLASRNKARLTLLETAEPLPARDTTYQGPRGEVDLQGIVAREHEAALAKVAAGMSEPGVKVAPRVVFDSPFMGVMRQVHEGGHDLVLVTAEGDGGLRDHLFGSTSRHLLRKCPCPVWVVRPARRRKSIRVLAAINPVETQPASRNLDRTVLEMASSLARMYAGELDIVHVWQQTPRSSRVHRNVVAKWNAEMFAQAQQRVNETLAPFDFGELRTRVHLPGGPTGLRIAEVADKRRTDVVVMGTLSRTGLRGLLMGNTCETVLQHIDASVLAVKPEGFVSPVTFD